MRPEEKNRYLELMFSTSTPRPGLLREALKTALDIRKFEIELYWKRALYFWGFIGAIFGGFFWAVKEFPLKEPAGNIAFMLACMGAVASWCWYLVLRGSKYWQENWERHVDFLEDELQGKLYKTVLSGKGIDEFNPLHAYPYSVSKINALIAFFVFVFWWFALVYVAWMPGAEITLLSFRLRLAFVVIALGFIGLAAKEGKTSSCGDVFNHDNHDFVPRERARDIRSDG